MAKTDKIEEKSINRKRNGVWKEKISRFNHRICSGIVVLYFLLMVGVYPYYAPGGYTQIGEVKYLFFRNVSLSMLIVVSGITLLQVLVRWNGEWIVEYYRRMSVTDWFVYGYCLAVMLSYLCSAYKEDALWVE